MGELPCPALLLDVPEHQPGHAPADRLAVTDPGAADVDVKPQLAPEFLHRHLQVQFTHARQHRLPGLRVGPHGQRGILLGQPCEPRRQPVGVSGPAGLDRDRDHRLGHPRRLQDQRGVRRAQGRAGAGGLEPDDGDDVAGDRPVQRGVPVCLDAQDPADPLGAPRARVPQGVSLLDRSRVDPQVGQPARRGGVHLEGEGGRRCRRVGGPLLLLTVVDAADRRHVQRRRQIGHDRVEQRLDTAVAVGGAAQHDHAVAVPGQVPQRREEGPLAERARVAELLQCSRMEFRHGLLQLPAACPGFGPEVVRDRSLLPGVTVAPQQCAHADEVDDAGEGVLRADRHLHDQRRRVQPFPDRRHGRVEVGTGTVHLVDERDPRYAVPVGLPPHRLALRLHPGHRVEHGHRTVEHPQRTLHLVGEVDVPRGVDQVDPVAVPGAAHGRGEDGDAPVPLLRVEVRDGRAVVDLAALVRGSGGEQDPFGDGGLAGVDVGEDAEVADDGERVVVDAHGPWPFEAIRKGAARFPGEAGVVTHTCFGVLTLGQHAEAGAFQAFVPVIRRRPRSGHRSDEDTRITS